jgi:nicotinate-nucleotide adenylyltransferase
MKIGLFFGSFNPLHLGHKIIASYISEFSDLDKVMFVLSPQNPFKNKTTLLDQHQRLMIIRKEIEDNIKLSVTDIEFNMPRPSYTIDTLIRLKEKNPENKYAIIVGSDNIKDFHKWKNYKQILDDYSVYIYERPGFKINKFHENIKVLKDVPQMEISASFIRNSLKAGHDVSYLIPKLAWNYIDEMNLYR